MPTLPNPTPTWRDLFIRLAPRWLKQSNGLRFLYAIGLQFDLLATAFDLGIRARFPGQQADALQLIGRERGITRGLAESDTSYAQRLRHWRNARRRKGNYFALLEQLQGALPTDWGCAIVSDAGFKYTLAPGGYVYAQYMYNPTNTPVGIVLVANQSAYWDWDGTTVPSRFWVLLLARDTQLWPSGDNVGTDGLWDDPGLIEDDGTWGTTARPIDVSALRAIIQDWTPPHAAPQQAIIIPTLPEYLAFPSASEPTTGDWDSPHLRNPAYEYWNLTT